MWKCRYCLTEVANTNGHAPACPVCEIFWMEWVDMSGTKHSVAVEFVSVGGITVPVTQYEDDFSWVDGLMRGILQGGPTDAELVEIDEAQARDEARHEDNLYRWAAG